MPIIIPTVAELDRMDPRQRAAVAKRISSEKARVADSVIALMGTGHASSLLSEDIAAARRRAVMEMNAATGQQIAASASLMLAEIGPDPDAARHVAELDSSIGRKR